MLNLNVKIYEDRFRGNDMIRKRRKLNTWIWFLILTMGVLWYAEGSEGQIRLVEEGSTDYRIMVGPGATLTEEFAAQELQGYLTQMSGAFLPMDRGNARSAGKHVLVGKGAITKLGIGVNEGYLGPDGFVIKTIGDKIILAGGSPRGTLYSVYAFLEMLGCRWIAPGIIGEVIPQAPNIVIEPVERFEQPGVKYRGFTSLIPAIHEGAQWIDWMSKNRMNYLMIPFSSYEDFKRILGSEVEKRGLYTGVSFEGFKLEDDQQSQSEVEANPAQKKALTERVLEFISNNPEVDIIAISVDVLEPYVESFAEIRKAICGQYPNGSTLLMMRDDTILDISYPICDTQFSASSTMRQTSRRCYRHSLGDDQCEINMGIKKYLEEHLKTLGIAHIYEYYMGTLDQNSLLFPILHTIASDIGYLGSLSGIDGVISQCEPGNWGTYGLNYYVFARMAWDTDADLGFIVDDYCNKYYGSASRPMKRYFARLEDAMAAMEHFSYINPPHLILNLLSEDLLNELDLAIQNAESLASDVIIFDRIRKVRLSLDHTKLLWHTLYDYFRGNELVKAGNFQEAKEYYQGSIDTCEELIAFLFQNIDEGIFVVSESYIFDYLEALMADARHRKEMSEEE